jgi:excisionase family DNA binding protein
VREPITRQTRFENLPDFLSVDETRKYLGLGRSTMYELLRRKELGHVRFGRVIRIPRSSLEKYVCGEGITLQGGRCARDVTERTTVEASQVNCAN